MFRRVVCGISGGVDSAVSALLLKNRGFNVCGVFMRNWDVHDEAGHCSGDHDWEDALFVCNKLNIPLHEVNFVKEYWNNVFTQTLIEYENGMTPNPDVLCNRHIKFGCFHDYAVNNLRADAVATGHYARNSFGQFLQHYDPDMKAHLLQAPDPIKDQTLFLCQVSQQALQRTMFPVGGLRKTQVKAIARENGLERIAKKKESMGICFIGSRNFHKFVEDYIEPKSGRFLDIETGEVLGSHKGTHYWTVGQRCLIGGRSIACFVASVNPTTQDIMVAQGTDHPALFSQSVYTSQPHWITDEPTSLTQHGELHCQFRFQHIHTLINCTVHGTPHRGLKVQLSSPLRALTPGQYAVFYHDDQCLGSAQIIQQGPSLYQQNQSLPENAHTHEHEKCAL